MFHSQSPQMVFSAYQLTKEPRVLKGQTEEQRDEYDVQAVCLSVQRCTCVEAEAWHLSGWGAYENISPRPGTILYLSNVSSGD